MYASRTVSAVLDCILSEFAKNSRKLLRYTKPTRAGPELGSSEAGVCMGLQREHLPEFVIATVNEERGQIKLNGTSIP